MKNRSPVDKSIAIATILSIHLLFLPVFGADTAALNGNIFSAGDSTPLAGVRVHVGDPASGRIYQSDWTGNDGSFRVEGLPAAGYELAVEANGGLYVVGSAVQLAPGQTRDVQLAINAAADPPQGMDDDNEGQGGFWRNPVTATLTVLGFAVLLGFIVDELDDDDDDDSPSNP
jgi:hypothetical protein